MNIKFMSSLLIMVLTFSIIYFSVFIILNNTNENVTELYFIDDSTFAVRGEGKFSYVMLNDDLIINQGTFSGNAHVDFIAPQTGRLTVVVGDMSIHYTK